MLKFPIDLFVHLCVVCLSQSQIKIYFAEMKLDRIRSRYTLQGKILNLLA